MPSTTLDGYENPDPTPKPIPYVWAKDQRPFKQISPISQRILNHIDQVESTGETARHSSFVVLPSSGIWRKMGNKTFYRLFGLRYIQHDSKKNGLQESIDKAKSRVFIKDASYTVSTALTLKPGIALEGESMPQLTNVDPIAPENITFTTNANGDTGTVLTTSGSNDCFTGTLLRTVSITNMGLSNFTNGFNVSTANVLGFSNSNLARLFFSNVARPLTLGNFQMLRLDQIYAWLPTVYFIQAVNNNVNWFGGNSYWTDLFAHGCKNVNGAVQLIAQSGVLNLIECHRLQVNMQDVGFSNSTSGYGLYLQGQAASTGLCSANTFHALNIEGTPLKAVRLEDWAFNNYIHIALDNLSAGGFDFSLKTNIGQAPLNNMLIYSNATTVAVESDNFQNFLISASNLKPVTGSFPSGITGIGLANFNGTPFTTMYGGGGGQQFVGGTTSNIVGSGVGQTAGVTVNTWQIPQAQQFEADIDLNMTAISAGSIQYQVTYTDENSNAQTAIVPLSSYAAGTTVASVTSTGLYSGHFKGTTKANTNIVQKTVASGFTGSYYVSGFVRASA